MQHNTAIKIGSAIALGIGIPLICWQLFRPPTWRDAQAAFEEAMVGGDPGPLERFYDEEELKAIGLTTKEATKIARKLLQPHFKGYTLLPVEEEPFIQGSIVSCPRPIMAGKTKILGGTYVLDGIEGPKVQFTFLALLCLFFLQQQVYEGDEWQLAEKHRALVDRLTENGVTGYWDRARGKVNPWVHLKPKKAQ